MHFMFKLSEYVIAPVAIFTSSISAPAEQLHFPWSFPAVLVIGGYSR